MRGLVTLSASAFMLFWPASLVAQNQLVAAPMELSDEFLQRLSNAEVDEAYKSFLRGSTIDATQVDALREKTKSALPLYGPIHGHELVREEVFGTWVVRLVYILRCQLHPITWEFYFYKPGDTWIVSSLKFMDTFDLLVRIR